MDIYDIAAKISLTNGVTPVLRIIARDFLGLRGEIGKTEEAMGRLKTVMAGAAMVGMSGLLLSGWVALAKAGGEVLNQQSLMLAAGWKQKDVADLTATAYREVARVMATTPAGALEAARTLLGIFGNAQEAGSGLDAFLKAQAVFGSRGMGGEAAAQLAIGVKALDIQGAFIKNGKLDIGSYENAVRELTALLVAFPHTLDMRTLFQFTRMAGPAAESMNLQDYLRTYAEVIASMGRTGGRGLQQLYHTLLGGDISRALGDELVHAHLVSPGAIERIPGSSREILNYKGIAGYQELTKNAAQWAHDVLFPLLQKEGFKGVPGMMQALGAMPITAQRLLAFFETNWAQIARGQQIVARAEGASNYGTLAAKNWGLAVTNFETSWDGLMQALGTPAAQMAVPVLNGIAQSVRSFTDFVGQNQWAARTLDDIGLALGVLLGYAGTRILGIAALKTLGMALPALAGGFGAFAEGTAAATALGLLTTGLPELALAIVGLSKVLPELLHPLQAWFAETVLGESPAQFAKTQKWSKNARAKGQAEVLSFIEHEILGENGGKFFNWGMPDNWNIGNAPGGGRGWRYNFGPSGQKTAAGINPFALPLPPAPGELPPSRSAPITIHAPVNVTLPLPPLSPSDVHAIVESGLYNLDPATIRALAKEIAAEGINQLAPAVKQIVHSEQAHKKRVTFLDWGAAGLATP